MTIPNISSWKINSDHHHGYSTKPGLVFILVILAGYRFPASAVMRQIGIQRQQQNFMIAITHELKTPISIARLNMETLLKHSSMIQKKRF
jgi:hypothetical protein